jgi:protein-disulfide isomerase
MQVTRRSLAKISLSAVALHGGAMAFLSQALADGENVLSRDAILRDPDIPATGNPDGDVTVVEYLDYQCPYCRKVHPILEQAAHEDGRTRLVYKNWPVFGEDSVYSAQMALAAREQGKYVQAHAALIGLNTKVTATVTDKALADAGIDVERAKAERVKNIQAIGAVLKRNHAQAEALGLRGTPGFIIGKFRVPGALSLENFKLAIADARKALAQDAKDGKK